MTKAYIGVFQFSALGEGQKPESASSEEGGGRGLGPPNLPNLAGVKGVIKG